MSYRFLKSLIAVPVLVMGNGALAEHVNDCNLPLSEIDTIHANPNECIITGDGVIAYGTDGRAVIKLDYKRETVQAHCTITGLDSGDVEFFLTGNSAEGFCCKVGISGANFILDGSYPDVKTTKNYRNGKARLDCRGPMPHSE